jgi:putative redox protein
LGGNDAGPSPYDLLLASLGACTSMTVRLYAKQKQWPLERIEVTLKHDKVHAADCAECETREGRIDRIEREIRLTGALDATQRQRLLKIANRCPVHRTLHSEVVIPTRLAAD